MPWASMTARIYFANVSLMTSRVVFPHSKLTRCLNLAKSAGESVSAGRIFLHTYAVTALNPKSIIFFVAFLPQFLDTTRPVFAQMVIFEVKKLWQVGMDRAHPECLGHQSERAVKLARARRRFEGKLVGRTATQLE